MKKRILSWLCALALCLGLLAAPLSVSAANNPCFMAVNDTLLDLVDQYIPITVSGQYYVPYTALDSSVTGVSLGISLIYNATNNTLIIYRNYNQERTLIFDLTSGSCTDRSGASISSVRAVIRNGRIYVPARFTSEYFGLSYSSRVTVYGPLVRIRNSSSKLDDNQFVDYAQQQMEARLRDWRKAQSKVDPPAVTPTPTPTPTTTPEPGDSNEDKSGVRTYLAFRADQTDGLEELLDRLEQYQVKALFFFPAEELADYDDAVRSVLCGGHAVGFLASGMSAEEISDQAREGNRLLTQIAHLNTYTVLAPDAETDAQREELSAAGLLCWSTDLDALPDGRSASRQASAVLANADLYRYEIFLLSDTSAAGAALMGRLLPDLVRDGYDLRLAVETELRK
ncbi:MAG: stalk domain-containing protein [Oscillospiraceae bacterium]